MPGHVPGWNHVDLIAKRRRRNAEISDISGDRNEIRVRIGNSDVNRDSVMVIPATMSADATVMSAMVTTVMSTDIATVMSTDVAAVMSTDIATVMSTDIAAVMSTDIATVSTDAAAVSTDTTAVSTDATTVSTAATMSTTAAVASATTAIHCAGCPCRRQSLVLNHTRLAHALFQIRFCGVRERWRTNPACACANDCGADK